MATFEQVGWQVEAELQAEKMALPMRKFEIGVEYNVDGQPGRFIQSFRNEEGRPKYVFFVNGLPKMIDFDFLYLVE